MNGGASSREIWGEQMHTNRHLRLVTAELLAVILVLAVALLAAPRDGWRSTGGGHYGS